MQTGAVRRASASCMANLNGSRRVSALTRVRQSSPPVSEATPPVETLTSSSALISGEQALDRIGMMQFSLQYVLWQQDRERMEGTVVSAICFLEGFGDADSPLPNRVHTEGDSAHLSRRPRGDVADLNEAEPTEVLPVLSPSLRTRHTTTKLTSIGSTDVRALLQHAVGVQLPLGVSSSFSVEHPISSAACFTHTAVHVAASLPLLPLQPKVLLLPRPQSPVPSPQKHAAASASTNAYSIAGRGDQPTTVPLPFSAPQLVRMWAAGANVPKSSIVMFLRGSAAQRTLGYYAFLSRCELLLAAEYDAAHVVRRLKREHSTRSAGVDEPECARTPPPPAAELSRTAIAPQSFAAMTKEQLSALLYTKAQDWKLFTEAWLALEDRWPQHAARAEFVRTLQRLHERKAAISGDERRLKRAVASALLHHGVVVSETTVAPASSSTFEEDRRRFQTPQSRLHRLRRK